MKAWGFWLIFAIGCLIGLMPFVVASRLAVVAGRLARARRPVIVRPFV